METDKDTIQQIVEEASTATGKGEQFIPIVIILEIVAALVSIWHDCHRKDQAAKLVMRAASMPWSFTAARVRAHVRDATPPQYQSDEFVDHVIRIAADKLRKSDAPLD